MEAVQVYREYSLHFSYCFCLTLATSCGVLASMSRAAYILAISAEASGYVSVRLGQLLAYHPR